MRNIPERLHIGLGGQRCGSTWLHENLSQHPDVVTAKGEKEVHFFDRRWDWGADWYFGLWDEAQGRGDAVVRWESTPNYLYAEGAVERIAKTCSTARFVVLLRDPVGRSRSHYQRYLANSADEAQFRDLLGRRPSLLRYSQYSEHLKPFFGAFGREAFFIGFYEDIRKRPAELLGEITDFMGLAPVPLSEEVLTGQVNAVRTPRSRVLYSSLYRTKKWMKRHGLDGIVAGVQRSGAVALLSRQSGAPKDAELDEGEIEMLRDLREQEINNLLQLGIDARHWATGETGL